MKRWNSGWLLAALSLGACTVGRTELGGSAGGFSEAGETGESSGGSAGKATGRGGRNAGGSTSNGGTTSDAGQTSAGGKNGTGGKVSTGGKTGDAGAAGSGGAPSCSCPEQAISWYEDGELPSMRTTLDCSNFSRDNTIPGQPYLCEAPNQGCVENQEYAAQALRVMALLKEPDITSVLAQAPILLGQDTRPVDGSAFIVRVGNAEVVIGSDCGPLEDCSYHVPEAWRELQQAMKDLTRRGGAVCSPNCYPTAPSNSGVSCAEPRWYWLYGSCQQLPGGSCDEGYASEHDCVDTHRQCVGLYDRRCGGFSGNTCKEDEYCAYVGENHCGDTDGGAVCMPRPTTCTEGAGIATCGCDGQVYNGPCDAARHGTGYRAVGTECEGVR